jgi:cyclophilin family peptidyl-prolyl cis-trans isomerase
MIPAKRFSAYSEGFSIIQGKMFKRFTNTDCSHYQPKGRVSLKSRWLVFCFALVVGSQALFGQINPVARFHTDLGDIDVVLLQNVAPNNVVNFLNYVNRGDYDTSFIHRSPPGFVIQGGGYILKNGTITAIPTDPPVVNEFHVSNTRGTLAMAKVANDPNSATSQWFFNESDANAANLDIQNGGFTVFGRITNSAGLATMDTIAAVQIYNKGGAFDQLPLLDYTGGTIHNSNLVNVIWIKVMPQILAVTHPAANTVHLQGIGVANMTYNVQTSSSPAANTFTTAGMVTADSTGNISYNDTSAVTAKFYRLAIP